MPFVIKKRQKLKLDPGSPVVAIFDNFRGQTTVTFEKSQYCANPVAC